MIKIYDVPHGIDEIVRKYGHPGREALDEEWYEKYTDVFELPVEMKLSWAPETRVRRLRAHREVGLSLVDAIAEVAWHYRERWEEFNHLGGVFNYRRKRGSGELSLHSWGVAIDLNPHLGRLGSREDAATYPRVIVEIFEERGWRWGGRWARPDAMHFQAAEGY